MDDFACQRVNIGPREGINGGMEAATGCFRVVGVWTAVECGGRLAVSLSLSSRPELRPKVCNREYPSGTKETVRLFLLTDVLRTEPNESTLNISSP